MLSRVCGSFGESCESLTTALSNSWEISSFRVYSYCWVVRVRGLAEFLNLLKSLVKRERVWLNWLSSPINAVILDLSVGVESVISRCSAVTAMANSIVAPVMTISLLFLLFCSFSVVFISAFSLSLISS